MSNKKRKTELKEKLKVASGNSITLHDLAVQNGIDPNSFLLDKDQLTQEELDFWYPKLEKDRFDFLDKKKEE